jgi:hypothetical protein
MGDKVVENNIEKWNEERQKFIAKIIGNEVKQGSKEENAIDEATNLNIIKGKVSKDSFGDNNETKEKCLSLESIGKEVLHPRAYIGNHGETVELKELNDKQVNFLKEKQIFDFYRRSKGAEGVTLPENKHFNLAYALQNALFLGKHKNNKNDVWLSDDGNFKEIVSDTEFKMNEGNIEEILGKYKGETPGNTIQGVASVIETTGGRKSRKTRRKKRKSKKSKKSRKSRK